MNEPVGVADESITVNGHMYVHVAACPCPAMVAASAYHAPDRIIGYTAYECERDMQQLYGKHCANPDEHA